MSDVAAFVLIAQTTMLVIVSILLLYPAVAYARNVAHTVGLALLSGSFLVLTVTYIVSFVFGMGVLSAVLDLLSAILAALGTWQFARPFIRFGGGEIETPTVGDATGGFESAGDD